MFEVLGTFLAWANSGVTKFIGYFMKENFDFENLFHKLISLFIRKNNFFCKLFLMCSFRNIVFFGSLSPQVSHIGKCGIVACKTLITSITPEALLCTDTMVLGFLIY